MPNEMNHAEVEYYLSSMANINLSFKEKLALDIAAADERRIANGELVEVVRCYECRKYHTPDCHSGHEQAAADYCSHGIRKGGEQYVK